MISTRLIPDASANPSGMGSLCAYTGLPSCVPVHSSYAPLMNSACPRRPGQSNATVSTACHNRKKRTMGHMQRRTRRKRTTLKMHALRANTPWIKMGAGREDTRAFMISHLAPLTTTLAYLCHNTCVKPSVAESVVFTIQFLQNMIHGVWHTVARRAPRSRSKPVQ